MKINTMYLNSVHFTTIQTDIYYQVNLAEDKNIATTHKQNRANNRTK